MLNPHRSQPGRMERAFAGSLPSHPVLKVEADRAPVTFGWWLYAQDRFIGNCHFETLYRLDRVGARLGDHSGVATLQPSEYYGQSADKLRELLRVRQHTILPPAPAGHRWIGPQLVKEVPCTIVHTQAGAGKLLHGDAGELPTDRKARLEFARDLANRILCERMAAA